MPRYLGKLVFIYILFWAMTFYAQSPVIEYPNWFYPIGALTPAAKYYIYFGLLLGSYYFLQKKIYIIKMDEDED